MTKRQLEARVRELEGEVARLSSAGGVAEHLGILRRALAPYLERLERVEAAERAVEEACDREELKLAILRLGTVRLDAREVGAMNNLLRQIAEIEGFLMARKPAGRVPGGVVPVVPEGGGERGRAVVPGNMVVLGNVMQLGRRNA